MRRNRSASLIALVIGVAACIPGAPTTGPTASDPLATPRTTPASTVPPTVAAPVRIRVRFADPSPPDDVLQAPQSEEVAVAGGAIWIERFDSDYGYQLLRFDPIREGVTATIRLDYPVMLLVAEDDSLWAVGPWGGAPGPVSYTVSRVNLVTGRLRSVAEIPAKGDVTVGLGSIWFGTWEHLTRTDLATGKQVGGWGVSADGLEIACDAVWSWDVNGHMARLDPTTGTVDRYAGEGPVHERLGECWHWVENGIERVWPRAATTTVTTASTLIWFEGSTFWRRPSGSMQRWDPATGTGVGPTWTIDEQDISPYPKLGDDGVVLSAAGTVWLVNGFEIVGFDIPAD